MKKILYVILHTSAHSDRYDGVVNSWGKNVDYLFYSDSDDIEKNIIKVSDDTAYKSNEEKHINIIKHLFEQDYQYEWFFFCDNDTFVNTKNLEANLDSFDKEKITGRIIPKCWLGDTSLLYCSGGAGYLMNKKVLSKIGGSIKKENTNYSDVSLGICARSLGVEFDNDDKFNSQTPEKSNLSDADIKDLYTFHYINPQKMHELYNLI